MYCFSDTVYKRKLGETMETGEHHRCEKCGQSFADSSLFASHLCPETFLMPLQAKHLENFKCSQCNKVFSKPGFLKRHFKVTHGGQNPKGPFLCSEQSCQFSSTDRQDYQTHLISTHSLSLVPCTVKSCKVLFITEEEMEEHSCGHNPFGCLQCSFVCQNENDLKDHIMEHNPSSVVPQGCKTPVHQPQVSERPKRNLKPSPALLPGEETGEQTKRQKGNRKRMKKALEGTTSFSLDSATLPSKEYLAEGSEHIYRTHTCPKCRRCFKMRSHLQEHLHLHFPDPSLQCPTCQRYFTSKSKLRIHQLREAGEKLHQCHLCDYSAVEKNTIRRHLASVHSTENSQNFPCLKCGQSFLQSRALKAHIKTHNIPSDSRPMSCFQEGCSFQSSSHKELLKHITEEHGVRIVECEHHTCGAVFQNESDMRAHYRSHLAYHCSQCDFSCSNKALFLQHQRQGHPGSDKLCCNFCSFVTFNPVEFEQHVGHLHASEKIHQCSQCSFVTSHKRGLKRHMLMHSGEKPHKCSLCDFRCRDESYLSKHMLTHSEKKNFMCAECGYVTKWKHYLTVHMRKHAGDLRYHCDQCSYRCHRMDQLNSHKLRHQAKSLMCEICAYACKRKYELRNHMLAKHSGEEKPASVYKCKYCTYTTCYRQALQNHENCKHTKLKEYSCALCFYSSFSSISLFLHKRKTHGYVPGDKVWLDNYAAKEKERNSAELLKDFYNKPSAALEQSEETTAEGHASSQIHQPEDPGSGGHCAEKDTVDGSKAVEVFKVPNEGISDDPTSIYSPEEYCTLVLTTLSPADYQEEKKKKPPSSPTLHPANVSTSSSEKDNIETDDEECEQSDIENNDESLNDTGQTFEPDDQILTPDLEKDDSTFSSSMLPKQSHPLEPEIHLKAMKKHDKDQAEAMFLEGRVQMLVVPAHQVFSCTECSYTTSKETALKYHREAVCRGRMKGHKCQACGAQFKQKRGFQSHLAKKCLAVQRKTRTFVGNSNTHLTPEDKSGAGQEGSKQLGVCTDQTELLFPHTGISTDSNDQVYQEERECTAHSSNCNPHNASTSRKSRHDQGQTLPKKHSKKSVCQSKQKSAPLHSHYTENNGKFKCKLCDFSSVKLATVKRHLTKCTEIRKKQNQNTSAVDYQDGGKSDKNFVEKCDNRMEKVSKKNQSFCCPNCTFKCSKKSGLDVHKKKGCFGSLTKKYKGAHSYCCRFCPFSTSRHYRLEEHESLHTGIGRQSCNICDKTFGTVTKLCQHKIRIHDKQPSHFCSLCDFSSYTLDDVRRHNLRCHTGELHHSCTHCDAQFSSEVALRNHCKRVHKLQVCFSCQQCDYMCSSEATLKSHQESKHPQVRCSTCQEVFETKESLETHQKTHLAHQCQLCAFGAKTKQLLAQHLLAEHEEGSPENKPLKCNACQFSCCHQLVLEQHLRSHGGRRLYKCTDCEYSTRNKQKITWHIRIHTGEKPYSCEQCSYSCTDPSRLKLHMRVHQEEKKYLCPECGYKCKWATQLKYHMTRHTGDKPYACDECEYRTNRADALRAHRDTQHCDLRPFVCEKCGKAFKTSFVLKTHQRQHSSDRPYTCGLCNKSFRWPAGLRHHYLSHTKQQPFCCRHCSYRAKQKFQVVKHLKRHHPEVSAEQGVMKDAEAVSLTLKEALQGKQEMEEEEEGETVDKEREDV